MADQNHPLPQAIPELPLPSTDLQAAVASMRAACEVWAPHSGHSNLHATEAKACDVVLARDQDFGLGVMIGFAAALLAGVIFTVAAKAAGTMIEIYRLGRSVPTQGKAVAP